MPVGIICAMPEEVDGFLPESARHADDAAYVESRFGGFDVVIANCGLGKVQAAMTASVMVERWQCGALVSAGTAGGLGSIEPMQVVVGTELLQHDYGRSRGPGDLELYRPGIPPLPGFRDIEPAFRLPEERLHRFREASRGLDYVQFGRFVSGDTFVNDSETKRKLMNLGAIAVDMESGAVAQVAERYGLPWLVAKGISDDASDMSHEAFLVGLAEASGRSAEVVGMLLEVLLDPDAA